MCAAIASAPIPLYEEGHKYWQDLTNECQRYVNCVNATLVHNGIEPDGLLECVATPESLQVVKAKHPATKVTLTLNFFSWGPVIGGIVSKHNHDGKPCLPQEFEMPIARDLDSQIIAIYDEGRSFSPHDVASYLTQCFHCCYPAISFPC